MPATIEELVDRAPELLIQVLDDLIEQSESGEDVHLDALVEVARLALRLNGPSESVVRFADAVCARGRGEGFDLDGPRVVRRARESDDRPDR